MTEHQGGGGEAAPRGARPGGNGRERLSGGRARGGRQKGGWEEAECGGGAAPPQPGPGGRRREMAAGSGPALRWPPRGRASWHRAVEALWVPPRSPRLRAAPGAQLRSARVAPPPAEGPLRGSPALP